MTTSASISRCPFCAVENPHLEETDVRSWAVVCGSCGAIGPVGGDEVQAVSRWNWRPTPSGGIGSARAA